jgi:general stress protein 26
MVVKSSRPPDELLDEFVRVAHRVVWCSLATVDRRGRPRSRVVHPYWERTADGVTGWIFTRPASPKVAHLTQTPYVSCSYWDPAQEVAVAECAAVLADDADSRRNLWDLVSAAPEPLGYDPRIMGCADPLDPVVTVVRMTPWRLATPAGAWQRAGLTASSAR